MAAEPGRAGSVETALKLRKAWLSWPLVSALANSPVSAECLPCADGWGLRGDPNQKPCLFSWCDKCKFPPRPAHGGPEVGAADLGAAWQAEPGQDFIASDTNTGRVALFAAVGDTRTHFLNQPQPGAEGEGLYQPLGPSPGPGRQQRGWGGVRAGARGLCQTGTACARAQAGGGGHSELGGLQSWRRKGES